MNQASNNTIIDDHRNMVMISKRISEFQENNLKAWPNIVFDNLEKFTVKFNFEKDHVFFEGEVIFDFTFKNGLIPDEQKKNKALEDLTNWTKFLFWSDTKVSYLLMGEKWT